MSIPEEPDETLDELLDANEKLSFDFEQAVTHPDVLTAFAKGVKAALPVIELVVFGGAEIAAALLAGPQGAAIVAQLVGVVMKLGGPQAAQQAQTHYDSTLKK
jgi:hypothetical protein